MQISNSTIILYLLRFMQLYGIFKFSVNIKKSDCTDYRNKRPFYFEFKNSALVKYWSLLVICIIFIFVMYREYIMFMATFSDNSNNRVFRTAYFLFETYLALINITIYYRTYTKSDLLKSVLRFQNSLTDDNTKNISCTFFKHFMSVFMITNIIFVLDFYKSSQKHGIINNLLLYFNHIAVYFVPFYKYIVIIGVFIFIVTTLAQTYDIRIHKFESIFHSEYYSNKNKIFNKKNVEIVLGYHFHEEKDKIIESLLLFSAKLHLLNINQNKLNDYFGTILTCIMGESIFWLVFGPFLVGFGIDLFAIVSALINISAPSTVLILCCIVPEIILSKVSRFQNKLVVFSFVKIFLYNSRSHCEGCITLAGVWYEISSHH